MIEPGHDTSDDFARRGDAIHETEVEPHLAPEDAGKFVAIDIDSGAYEIARHELTALDRLRARKPRARIWLRRIGSRYLYRLGLRTASLPT